MIACPETIMSALAQFQTLDDLAVVDELAARVEAYDDGAAEQLADALRGPFAGSAAEFRRPRRRRRGGMYGADGPGR